MEELLLVKTKKLLKRYKKAKFDVEIGLEDLGAELEESDMKSIKDLMDSVLGEDLIMDGMKLTERLQNIRKSAILLRHMERCLIGLQKYPDKGKIYYEMLHRLYFSGKCRCHEEVMGLMDMPRSTYFRYYKTAEKMYSKLLWIYKTDLEVS